MTELLQEQSADRGAQNYRSGLRSAVRSLWSGAMDEFQSWEIFQLSIRNNFTRAYRDGSKEVGILPAEWTPAERMWLEDKIRTEMGFIDGFLDAIEAGSKTNGGKLTPLFKRVESWIKRYQEVYTQGQMTAKTDPKMKWIKTALESCVDCIRLDGKVKRLSQWRAADLQPQSPRLACMRSAGGPTVCKCHFEKTTERLSSGPLPRI